MKHIEQNLYVSVVSLDGGSNCLICCSNEQLALFAYWCGTNGVAVIVLYLNALPCLTVDPTVIQSIAQAKRSSSRSSKKSASSQKAADDKDTQAPAAAASGPKLPQKTRSRLSTLVRKQFHLVAIVAVLPGLVFDIKIASLALTCGVIVFVMLEVTV